MRQDVTVNDAEPLLQLRGIGKNFGPVHALTDINLDIPPGRSPPWSATTARASPR
jgi:hypothetical protein